MATRKQWASRPGRSSKWITRTKRLAIYIRDSFTCQYCGTDLRDAPPRAIGLDHLTPQSKGGTHDATNLITACSSCNFARHAMPWRRFATSETVRARITRQRRRVLNRPLALALFKGLISKWELPND